MSFSPSDSAIKVTPEIEKHLQTLTSADSIKAYLASVATEQGLVRSDLFDPNLKIPVEPGTQPRAYAKTIVVNGVKHVIEGATEQELLAAENAFFKAQFSEPTTHETPTQPRNSVGQFTTQEEADRAAQEDLVRKADLELQFKRGEISASDYLEKSGAVAEYLAKQGVPIEDLQASVAEKQNQHLSTSWESATEEFLKTSDWPGGQENLARIGKILEEKGLVDAPSVENLAAAYEYMKSNGMLVPNEELELQNRIANAKSPEELRIALGRSSSSLWGR